MGVNEFNILGSEIEITNKIGRTTNRAYKYIRKVISCYQFTITIWGNSMSI